MQYKPKTLTTAEKMTRITTALADLDRQLANLHAQVTALEQAGICTGTTYWRRDNGSLPKLYANHSIDQACPIHGEPKPGDRLRTYVGTDVDKQAEAQAAMDRCEEKAALEQQIRQIEMRVARIERTISNAYYAAFSQQRWEW